MSFSMSVLNQSINTMENYATRIQITLSFILKLKMFINTLQITLKKDLINQIMQSKDQCQ